ncbi:sensor histidine kinase [Romboutsia maritimum]|uniref:histidine kinase n=1 Tax=Romboutsia maritimum TaxID=2020948 RepID=A0A371IUK0_9FIRM|nr:HAMP domain-containing sensor histidine kinase [Romboutsia maritimum]RDY24162.1 sensor histidine kinase [Romboutsia maritimum]
MKNGIFKRLFKTISIITIVSVIITILFSSFAVKQYFLNTMLEETQIKVKNLAKNIGERDYSINGIIHKQSITSSIIQCYDSSNDNMARIYNCPGKINHDIFSEKDINIALNPYMSTVLGGNSIKRMTKLEGLKEDVMIIGEPIKRNYKIIGSVFVIKLIEEYESSLIGFYIVLSVSMVLALVSILVPAHIFLRKLYKPLNDVTEAAILMSQGDFSIRTKEYEGDEIGKLAKSFNYLASKLEENDKQAKLLEQTRRDYVANVSHELKTPISTIRAVAETLNDDMLIDIIDKKKYYSMILRESMRLQLLIKDMLELSRLQSGNVSLKKSVVNIREIFLDTIEKFDVIADDLEINFIKKVDIEDTLSIFTNRNRIEQVLVILLDNAFKFTPIEGSVTLEVKKKEEYLEVIISDTGVGIDKEDIAFIFDRFYKVDKAHSSKGTGIGLSIAWEIMKYLNEDIYVKSELGKGSDFAFTIHYK